MPYALLRPLLFQLPPETAHRVALEVFAALERLGAARLLPQAARAQPVTAMGLAFPNPVGLAAGLDKNGEYIDALAALGFGFIEVGTVTPRPQPGNPRPRLFRIPEARALVNRMGFNNAGVDALLENVARARYRGVLGINIGKNFDTPIERAVEDYRACLIKVYPVASYAVVNVSSPNTPGLRGLQEAGELDALLAALKSEQTRLADRHGRYVPLAVKIAPDLTAEQVDAVAALLVRHGIDGVIATNTTVSREGVAQYPAAREAGGLSGAPLKAKSTEVIRKLAHALQGAIPIIGVGGILESADAQEKISAGASLVQLYTGLIYRGPGLVREVVEALGQD